MKNKTIKLKDSPIEFNGVTLTITHDFEHGAVNSFDAAFQNWLVRTDELTPESFIRYVKNIEPDRTIMTKKQWETGIK